VTTALVDATEKSKREISSSTIYLSLFTESFTKDPVCLIQLALAVILNKPIMILVADGIKVPKNIVRLAYAIDTCDPKVPGSVEAAAERMRATFDAIIKKENAQ
jgi:hypothetical protein